MVPPTALDIIGQSIACALRTVLTSQAIARGISLTTRIEGAFYNPIFGGRNPNYRADTLGCDHAHSNVHFVIRDVSVFGINNHELART